MDADHPVPLQRRRGLGNLRAPALKALAVASAFLLVPPLAWLAGDLWRLGRVPDEEGNREEAGDLLLRSVLERAHEVQQWRFLHQRLGPEVPASALPVISYRPMPRRADEVIPSCTPAREGLNRVPANWPRLAADRAQFSATQARLGTATIVAFDVCLNATPFAGLCERRLRKAQEFTIEEIGAEAVRLKYARVDRGRTCWCSSYACANEDG